MNTSRYFSMTALTAAIALGLTACGGGSSTTSSLDGSTASVTGVITGFGSIFVNGVEYETNGANIVIDGKPGTEDDLRVGMVVTLEGSASGNSGTAVSISFSDEMEGPIESVSVAADGTGTLTVMGQNVEITADTVFDSNVAGVTAVEQLAQGHIVEISGYGDGAGNVIATRIELKAPDALTYLNNGNDDLELKGLISNLDTTNKTFQIGNMTVNYSGATLEGELSNGLQEGVYVEVKFRVDANGNLVVAKIELENEGKKGPKGEEGEDHEIKGAVVGSPSGSMFNIGGQEIIVTASTEFEGVSMGQIDHGTYIEVEGYFDAEGRLVAREIKMERKHGSSGCSEIEGTVSDISLDDGAVNSGAVTIGTTMVYIDNSTIMEDDVDESSRFNLSKLNQGDRVEVRACADGDRLVAAKLERDDDSSGSDDNS